MKTGVLLLLSIFSITGNAQQPESTRIKELEQKLDHATRQLEQLNEAVQSLRAEIAKLKGGINQDAQSPTASTLQPEQAEAARSELAERIIEPGMGASEREEALRARPEIFIQSRYSALPIRGSNGEFEPNLSMTRIETRWSGRVSERIGAGLEIQFHPALDGSAEELVNDAFVEYYLNNHATLRVGQYIKPFGFDIQQSSAVRESPERGIFAGYFFPGQRDRGVMFFGDLNFTALKNVHYFIGAFNFGYLRYLGEMTRIGVDYQFKNRPSFNDDAVNGRFHINWSIEF
jgi:cell division protein FtsB